MPGEAMRRRVEPLRRALAAVWIRGAIRRSIELANRWRQAELALALGLVYEHWREGTIKRAVKALVAAAAEATRERLEGKEEV